MICKLGVKEQLLNVTANKANYDEVISNLTVGVDYLVQLKSWSRFSESKYSVPIQATVQGSGRKLMFILGNSVTV